MVVRLIVLLALTAVVAAAGSLPGRASELRHERYPSAAFGHDVGVLVYVPDGYETAPVRYPVLYLLHGAGADENAWRDLGHIKEKADALIAKGVIPPTLIVMPGCPGTWWVDGAKEKAETAFWNDIVPAVAAHYRTIETRNGRLIAGLSAGGFGAVRFALRYPDRFAAAAALSPAIYADTPPQNSAARVNPPFLDATGTFSQKLWEAQNYPSLIGGYFRQNNRIPVYLVSGDADAFGIAFETALLFKRLFEKQADKVELRIVDGGHSWRVWDAVIDDAMVYMFHFADKPQRAARTAKAVSGAMSEFNLPHAPL